MKVRVLYFAHYRELAGMSDEELSLEDGSTVGDFLETIKRLHKPLEREGKRIIIAVNNEYAKNDIKLREGDQVALFPPVSGG